MEAPLVFLGQHLQPPGVPTLMVQGLQDILAEAPHAAHAEKDNSFLPPCLVWRDPLFGLAGSPVWSGRIPGIRKHGKPNTGSFLCQCHGQLGRLVAKVETWSQSQENKWKQPTVRRCFFLTCRDSALTKRRCSFWLPGVQRGVLQVSSSALPR